MKINKKTSLTLFFTTIFFTLIIHPAESGKPIKLDEAFCNPFERALINRHADKRSLAFFNIDRLYEIANFERKVSESQENPFILSPYHVHDTPTPYIGFLKKLNTYPIDSRKHPYPCTAYICKGRKAFFPFLCILPEKQREQEQNTHEYYELLGEKTYRAEELSEITPITVGMIKNLSLILTIIYNTTKKRIISAPQRKGFWSLKRRRGDSMAWLEHHDDCFLYTNYYNVWYSAAWFCILTQSLGKTPKEKSLIIRPFYISHRDANNVAESTVSDSSSISSENNDTETTSPESTVSNANKGKGDIRIVRPSPLSLKKQRWLNKVNCLKNQLNQWFKKQKEAHLRQTARIFPSSE